EHVNTSPVEDFELIRTSRRVPVFDDSHVWFRSMSECTISNIRERMQSGDFLCLIAGQAQQPIADALPELPCVEFGIGYGGVFAPYRVFESYAWMHVVLGATEGSPGSDGHFYHTVIPNYFEDEEFTLGAGDGDYLLYAGRLIERKGVHIITEIAKRVDIP